MTLVSGATAKQIDPDMYPNPEMLRLEFSSRTDLYQASDGGGEGLYVFVSFCPFQDENPLWVSEPYYNDRQRYDPVTHKDRRPTKDPVTGDYVYTTYLPVSSQMTIDHADGRPDYREHDLRKQQGDLCLRIEHPGYFITPSRSRAFVVPAAMIRRALSA